MRFKFSAFSFHSVWPELRDQENEVSECKNTLAEKGILTGKI